MSIAATDAILAHDRVQGEGLIHRASGHRQGWQGHGYQEDGEDCSSSGLCETHAECCWDTGCDECELHALECECTPYERERAGHARRVEQNQREIEDHEAVERGRRLWQAALEHNAMEEELAHAENELRDWGLVLRDHWLVLHPLNPLVSPLPTTPGFGFENEEGTV